MAKQLAVRLANVGLPSLALHRAKRFGGRRMERETGIEPATNSLEGCDSTTELLPPSPASAPTSLNASARQAHFGLSPARRRSRRRPITACLDEACQRSHQAKSGGEGRIRTFEAAGATDLQSVAFDRFATSPTTPSRACWSAANAQHSTASLCSARHAPDATFESSNCIC